MTYNLTWEQKSKLKFKHPKLKQKWKKKIFLISNVSWRREKLLIKWLNGWLRILNLIINAKHNINILVFEGQWLVEKLKQLNLEYLQIPNIHKPCLFLKSDYYRQTNHSFDFKICPQQLITPNPFIFYFIFLSQWLNAYIVNTSIIIVNIDNSL